MFDTPQDVVYWILMGLISFVILMIGILLPILINRLIKVSDGTRLEISGLRVEIKEERIDRVRAYGEIMAKMAARDAICDERHGKTGRRVTDV